MRLNLTIQITDIDFDPSVCLLRLNGKNLTESPHIKVNNNI
jgi:protein pelota